MANKFIVYLSESCMDVEDEVIDRVEARLAKKLCSVIDSVVVLPSYVDRVEILHTDR